MSTLSQRTMMAVYQDDFEKTLSHDKFSLRSTEDERAKEEVYLSQRFLRNSINVNDDHDEEYNDMSGDEAASKLPTVESKTGIIMSAFNLMNDVVTVSCVSMPFYFQSSGVPFSFIMIFVFALINSWTLFVVYNIKQKRPASNDFMVMNELTIGKVSLLTSLLISLLTSLS